MEANTKLNGGVLQAGAVLLPPAAFSSEPSQNQLLSPSKFVSSEPRHRKTVRIAAPSPTPSSTSSASPPSSPKKSLKGSVSKENVCSSRDGEVQRLRMENYRLMEDNLKKTYEYCAMPNAPSTQPLQSIDINTQKHVDSLINKQAEEINYLKTQLLEAQRECECILSETRRDASNREESYQHELSVLRGRHDQELRAVGDQVADAETASRKMQSEFEERCSKLESSVLEERAKLEECLVAKDSLRGTINTLQSQLRAVQDTSDENEKTVQQLRTQLCTYQQRDGEKERWPQERICLENSLASVTSECEALRSENEALQIRVSSMDNIMSAQQDSLRTSSKDSGEDRLHSLLNSWRYKVYQLLVQQKSQELVNRKDYHDNRQQVDSLNTRINSLQSRIRELTSTVADRDGQLKVISQQKQRLELSVAELQERITSYKEREARERDMCRLAGTAVKDLYEQYTMQVKVLETIDARVRIQDSRVIGACKQLVLCQATSEKKFAGLLGDFTKKFGECEELGGKLSKIVGECEELGGKLSEKVGECEELTEKLANSELVKREVQQRLDELQQNLITQLQLVREKEQTIDELKDETSRLTNHMDLERKRVELEVEGEYKDRIGQYEMELVSLKRDLAKTVVALRQTERRQVADQTSHARELKDVTSHNENRIQTLQTELADVQSERNILHSNLSAVGSVKQRPPPRVTSSLSTSPLKTDSVEHSLHDRRLLLGSVSRLAASVLDSDSDGDDGSLGDHTPAPSYCPSSP